MNQILKVLLVFPVKLYQKLVSPLLPPSCRFHPSCSQYMIEAIMEWGAARGLLMGVARLLRCHPWSEGGHDPVPSRRKQ